MAHRRDSPPASSKPRWGLWIGLMGLNLALALGLVWVGVQIHQWQQRGDGWGALWMLVGIGLLSTLAVAMGLITQGPRFPPRQMVTLSLSLWGWGLGGSVGLGIGFPLLMLTIQLPILIGYPWLLWPWLVIVLPTLVLSLWEWVSAAQVARTPTNFGWLLALYLAYFCGMNGLILLTLGAFLAIFPLGVGLQLISGVNLLILWAQDIDALPLLCRWTSQSSVLFMGASHCGRVLWGFHLGHGLVLGLSLVYGRRLFNRGVTGYGQGIRWLRNRLTR